MTAKPDVDERRSLIPRWRRSGMVSHRWEVRSNPTIRVQGTPVADMLTEKIEAWLNKHSVETAVEVVQEAIVTNRFYDAFGAAEYLLLPEVGATSSVRQMAAAIRYPAPIDIGHESSLPATNDRTGLLLYSDIRKLKKRLEAGPRDPLSWSDLALLYATVGQSNKAEMAMERAIAAANGNRTVLRAAVRLFVHRGDAERALQLLRRQERSRYDPWLASPEIAVATLLSRPPRFVKDAKKLLDQFEDSPGFITELAGSLGSIELAAGSIKQARRYFRKSLIDPNDNTVAQVIWANRQSKDLVVLDEATLSRPGTYEARAMKAFWTSNWTTAQEQAASWAGDEPFSVRPAQLSSYIGCAITADYNFASYIAEVGLHSNPGDVLLRNNLIVALAMSGQVDRAVKELARLPRHVADHSLQCTITATHGLVAYCQGNLDLARGYYEAAYKVVDGGKDLDRIRGNLLIHFAEQELLHGDLARAVEVLTSNKIEKLAQTMRSYPDLSYMLQRVVRNIKGALEKLSIEASSDVDQLDLLTT